MENLNKAIIAEITGLAIDIQNTGIGDVMISVSGHVCGVSVEIYLGGWVRDANADHRIHCYVNPEYRELSSTPQEAIKQLTALLTPVSA